MKYFKIGDKIYNESYLKENSDLLLFGAMPEEAFLRRILKCYDIDLYYNLKNKQIMIKDLQNNCILENNTTDSLWSSKDVIFNLNYDCNEKVLIVNIKRQAGLDISLKVDLINSIDWLKKDKNEYSKYYLNHNSDLIEFQYSKYGKCEFKNNLSGYTFIYDTEQLNNNSTRAVTINITSPTTQNRINYNLNGGELSTIYCYSEDNNLKKENNIFIPIEKCNNSSNQDLKPVKNNQLFTSDLIPITPIIEDDLNVLKKLAHSSRIEYLKSCEKNLLEKLKTTFIEIIKLSKKYEKIKNELKQIQKELSNSLKQGTSDDRHNRYAKKANN